ncbi:MAG: hypothetical protein RIC55_25820 [Pirellulaceae bacterium]
MSETKTTTKDSPLSDPHAAPAEDWPIEDFDFDFDEDFEAEVDEHY